MKLSIKLFFLAFLSIAIYSCESELLEKEDIKDNLLEQAIPIDVEVENGMLKFENGQHFIDALSTLSDSEENHYTEDQLDDWEESLGIVSLRRATNLIYQEYESLQSKEEVDSYISTNGQYFDEDKNFKPSNVSGVIASVLNINNCVLIGKVLHYFDDNCQIVVLDRDYSKVAIAKKSKVSVPSNEIYYFSNAPEDIESRTACSSNILDCTDIAGSKRVRGEWRLSLIVTPVLDPNCNCIVYFHVYTNYSCEIQSHKKSWLGTWLRNHGDDISWDTGYGLEVVYSGSPVIVNQYYGGTGWTQNSWKINYFKSKQMSHMPLSTTSYDFGFIYNYNNVENISVNGLQCDDDCN